ncbi:MAG: NADH-quinone oxidoreductase subunit M, partial [Magnetococcales bacterium]|nr:NADH-quinone oxidoreductase subunit M [Magnetococcales bacterium]
MNASFPLLTTLILWPMLAAALLLLLPNRLARSLALLAAMAQLVLAAWLLTDMGPNFRWVERFEWIPSLKIQYLLGVDGLSMLFLPLAAWLFVAVIASGWNQVQTLPRVYYALLLMLEGITMGIFSALDTILFFLFWEASLIPLFVLILLWGVGPRRRMAAIKYTLLMLAGGVALLLGFIMAALHQMEMGNPWLFDLPLLLENPLPGPVQTWVFLLLLAGFAIKVPVIPLHTWLPLLALEGPIGVLAIMTGIKLGVYGLMRFAIPIAPQAALEYQWLLSVLGGVGVLYGSLAALLQTNVRPMLAFASI